MSGADLRFYFSLLLQRLPYLVVIGIIGTVIGVAIAYSQRPIYRATAQILVESPQIPSELARSTVPENAVVQVQIIEQELITRDALVALADRLQVYPSDVDMTASDIVEDMRARISIEQILLGGGERAATAFAVSFDAANPDLAANVTNELVGSILRKDSERRTLRATDTLTFFQQDVARLSQELGSLDAQLLEFKNQHMNELPDSLDFRRLRQGNQEERLLILDREEASLRSRRANLVMLFRATGQGPGTAETPEGRLRAQLHGALAAQSAIFSAESPAIVALRSRIAAMDREVEASEGAAGEEGETSPQQIRPLSDLDIQLADIDDRLLGIAKEKEAIQASIASLNASIEATPKNETALNILERDRDNVQLLHSAAVARLAEASTGEQIESRLKGERLSLIEAALPPQDPLPTKRLIIAIGGAMGGLALGLAVVAALELLNRRVRRPIDLQRALDIEPMITIPYIRSSSEIWSRRAAALTAVALVVAMLSALPLLSLSSDFPFLAAMNTMFGHSVGGV